MLKFKMGNSLLPIFLLLNCCQWISINAALSEIQIIQLCRGNYMEIIAYPGDEHKFIVCLDENTQIGLCREEPNPDNSQETLETCFNEKKKSCHLDFCSPTQAPSDYENFVATYCKNDKNWLVKLPAEDCEHFYVCLGSNTQYIYESCPQDTHFSRETKNCVHPIEASCQSLDSMCSGKNTGYRFSSTNCYDYYECVSSQAVAHSCAYNEHFDSKGKKCIPSNKSQCKEETQRLPKCAVNDNGLYLPHSKCNKFYVCINTVPLEAQCADGYYFDANTQICQKDNNNVCVN